MKAQINISSIRPSCGGTTWMQSLVPDVSWVQQGQSNLGLTEVKGHLMEDKKQEEKNWQPMKLVLNWILIGYHLPAVRELLPLWWNQLSNRVYSLIWVILQSSARCTWWLLFLLHTFKNILHHDRCCQFRERIKVYNVLLSQLPGNSGLLYRRSDTLKIWRKNNSMGFIFYFLYLSLSYFKMTAGFQPDSQLTKTFTKIYKTSDIQKKHNDRGSP